MLWCCNSEANQAVWVSQVGSNVETDTNRQQYWIFHDLTPNDQLTETCSFYVSFWTPNNGKYSLLLWVCSSAKEACSSKVEELGENMHYNHVYRWKGQTPLQGPQENLKASQEYPKAFGMEATWFYFIWSLYGDYNYMQLYIISM